MNKFNSLNSPAAGMWSHSGRTTAPGVGWYHKGRRKYTKIYVHGRTKAFLPFNVVCLDVRKIASARRLCLGIALVQNHPLHSPLTHTRMQTHPQMYFLFGRRRREWGEQKQCSEADVITKGNTSCASRSLSDPHGGSKSELIGVPQNEEIFQQRWQVLPALFRCDTLGRWWWWLRHGVGDDNKWGNSPSYDSW